MPPVGSTVGALYHSLVLLRMGETIDWNMLSWLGLLMNTIIVESSWLFIIIIIIIIIII